MTATSVPQLDPHGQELLEQYRSLLPIYSEIDRVIPEKLKEFFAEAGIIVAAVEHRVKEEGSLAGKLKLKGGKYRDIFDITDLVGIRVITFYIDDVDKVASVLARPTTSTPSATCPCTTSAASRSTPTPTRSIRKSTRSASRCRCAPSCSMPGPT